MNIVVATGNLHKKRELHEILPGVNLLLPADVGVTFDFEETEDSFLGNALGKARTLFGKTGSPVLADDSGLVVPSLGGEPGIYSARYGADHFGRNLESEERNRYLLDKMAHSEDREAYFICCMVLMLEAQRVFTVQETFHGTIMKAPSGTGGFGYDPVFFVPELGKSAAELTSREKNQISHRGKAGLRIARLLSADL